MTHRLVSEIPNSQGIIIPRMRHNVLMEVPEVVGGLMREFFTAESISDSSNPDARPS